MISVFRQPISTSINFPLVDENNQILQFYDPSYYAFYDFVKNLATLVSVVCIIGVVFACVTYFIDNRNSRQVLMLIELSQVVQLSYFTIINSTQINPLIIALANGLKLSTGIDITVVGTTTDIPQFKHLGITSSHFSDNVNISLALPLVLFLIGLLLKLIERLMP